MGKKINHTEEEADDAIEVVSAPPEPKISTVKYTGPNCIWLDGLRVKPGEWDETQRSINLAAHPRLSAYFS